MDKATFRKYLPATIAGLAVWIVVSVGIGVAAAAGGVEPSLPARMAGTILGFVTFFIVGSLSDNRKAPTASDADRAAVLAFAPPPGRAMLVVHRQGFVGSATGLNVSVDGRPVAQLKSPRFAALSLAPGPHRLELAFGGLAAKQNRPAALDLVLADGQVAAYRADLGMGLAKNTIKLTPVTADADLRDRLSKVRMVRAEP